MNSHAAVALDIARQLVDEAIWYRSRCTWISAEPSPGNTDDLGTSVTWRACGPDLYGGISGIALFLGEAARAEGDSRLSTTALGAMRQACALAKGLRRERGYFAGLAGVCWAAWRVGAAIGASELQERAIQLSARLRGTDAKTAGHDIISGASGTIATLIRLANASGQHDLLSDASYIAETLVRASRRTGRGRSWAGDDRGRYLHLTGFAHGAAGPAYSLTLLSHATHDPRWLPVAAEAIAYERSFFDQQRQNWPDLRHTVDDRGPFAYGAMWCHGAPGIALGRLVGAGITANNPWHSDASAGLATTRAAVTDATVFDDFSLCHGNGGLADILLEASRVFPEDAGKNENVAMTLLERGAANYGGRTIRDWPGGSHARPTPGLMLGAAGIGMLYLRAADATIPTPLLP